jgi:aminoglycoside 3-N-acetyltransferase
VTNVPLRPTRGSSSGTEVHYAEQRAGRELFRRWSRDRNGAIIESQVESCSEGFERLSDALRPLERSIDVGASHWRAYPAAEFVDLAARTIRENPAITHCDNENCSRCNDAVLGGPLGIDMMV